jgi:regulator of sirC expression with transglutaminase-like and TPR domain
MIAHTQFRALESILADNDPETIQAVVAELVGDRTGHEETVRMLAASPHDAVRRHASTILAAWGIAVPALPSPACGKSLPLLSEWCLLEELCWQLARVEHRSFDPATGTAQLQAWSERVERELPRRTPRPEEVIRALQRVLHEEEHLRANLEDYYDPDNTYLDKVLDRRVGIPLSLSLVYIFVARRIGFPVEGVNTPGHYLARLGTVIFDPFNGGRIVPHEQLAVRFPGPACLWNNPSHYRATPYDTGRRMFVNLLNCYLRREDETAHARIASYLQLLE